MPTTVTSTIKSSGGDYTSLSAWEAAVQADIVAADQIQQAECYAFQDTTACTINGWTTDATRYIRIYTPSAERHAGVFDAAKYNIKLTGAFSRPLTIVEEFVRVEGIQLWSSATTNGFNALNIQTTATSDVRVSETICRCNSTGTNDGFHSCMRVEGGTVRFQNIIAYGGRQVLSAAVVTDAIDITADNCTFAKGGVYGVIRTSGTVALTNCYSGGNGTDAYNGTITFTTCAHDTATSFTGSTGSIAHSTDTFVNVTAGSEDYHLADGSALIDVGTDLSGTFTTDIDGDTIVTWDIGADDGAEAATQSALLLMTCSYFATR